MNKKVLLMILDGWGISKDPTVSAIDHAKTPFIDSLYDNYSNTTLNASGLDVGFGLYSISFNTFLKNKYN